MTIRECSKLLAILKANYPSSYKGLADEDVNATINIWAELFADDDIREVMNAVKSIILSDPSDFAPNIGKIKNKMYDLREKASGNDMTAAEAWALVKAALSRGIYYSEEEFNKLPAKIQRIVGSPNQLRTWAVGDIDATDTVIASNFMRSYNAMRENDRKQALLPQAMLKGIEG